MRKTPQKSPARSVPIILIRKQDLSHWLTDQDDFTNHWIKASGFKAEIFKSLLVPAAQGHAACVLAGVGDTLDIWSLAALPQQLPAGEYRLQSPVRKEAANAIMLGWLLGAYQFTRYKKSNKKWPTLHAPAGCDVTRVRHMAESINLARDLINIPANDMGPAELAAACKKVAQECGAQYHEIVGEELLKHNYPAVYTVGMASTRAPRLVDMRWGKRGPKVTLVGKGVCFDSGGLDIKSSSNMKLMKKDMGGAACVLALARIIMLSGLPVQLRVLIPAVENSISGNAYRPYDIINTRKGMTVEVGNTDAEGRLILCDALYEADQEKPDLLIDCATLTGAARTALGTDVPALFTPDDALAHDLLRHSKEQKDALWRLPLWQDYREMLTSNNADINSAPDSGYAGAITAALYLKEFVTHTTSWAHIDMMAWNLTKRPGRPIGGEAMGVRALFSFIQERCA